MNAVLRDAIMQGLGVGEKKQTNGLERFAGSLSEGFGSEFEKAMEDCSQINWEDWK